MKIEIGDHIKGINRNGSKIEGKVVDILRKIEIIQVRVGEDGFNIENCMLKDIEKVSK